jgi:hypothetical protein
MEFSLYHLWIQFYGLQAIEEEILFQNEVLERSTL